MKRNCLALASLVMVCSLSACTWTQVMTTLSSGGIGEQLRERIQTECAELLEKYPDEDGWLKKVPPGDIPFLADPEYIDRCVSGYGAVFVVSMPEELASACWYVNTQGAADISFAADIDLSGYNWAPIGWSGHAFTGSVAGNGFIISNMTVDCSGLPCDAGFIGHENNCSVSSLTFDGADVCAGTRPGDGAASGVAAGSSVGGRFENVVVKNSRVVGNKAGTLLGWDASRSTNGCSVQNVTVNGSPCEFLSFNELNSQSITVEYPAEITINGTNTVTRSGGSEYETLNWVVECDGERVCQVDAKSDRSYTCDYTRPGDYTIHLEAFVSGQYVPISNTVIYTIE